MGDYNGNGLIDAADYLVWRDTMGQSAGLAAVGNGNNQIDEADYNVWRRNFGQATGLAAASGATDLAALVPEPASIYLIALAALIGAAIAGRRPK